MSIKTGQLQYYDPGTAQFLTRDPMVAQSRSVYGYTNNSPLNATDPSGMFVDGGAITGTAGAAVAAGVAPVVAAVAIGAGLGVAIWATDAAGLNDPFEHLGAGIEDLIHPDPQPEPSASGAGARSGGGAADCSPEAMKPIRDLYHGIMNNMHATEDAMRLGGASDEQIARKLVAMRNEAKVIARSLMPRELVEGLEKRNQEICKDPIGPSPEWLFKKNEGNWAEVFKGAYRSDPVTDAWVNGCL